MSGAKGGVAMNAKNHYDDPAFFEAYAQMARSRMGLEGAGEWPQLKKLFPDAAGMDVLDIGCGYGWHCRYAAGMGAKSVLGIDRSEKMIARARQSNADGKITYRVCSLQEYDYPAEAYDLVISNLVLHYVEDLDEVYHRVYTTLRPGGILLINIEHPTFTAGVNQQFAADGTWPVDNYFYPGWRQTDFLGATVTKYHHTLTQILMGMLDAGLKIEAVEEAVPPEEWRSALPEEMRRPMMLLVRAIKPHKTDQI